MKNLKCICTFRCALEPVFQQLLGVNISHRKVNSKLSKESIVCFGLKLYKFLENFVMIRINTHVRQLGTFDGSSLKIWKSSKVSFEMHHIADDNRLEKNIRLEKNSKLKSTKGNFSKSYL